MSETTEYKGRCFCGAVEFTLTGDPAAMAYCHCDSCRQWSGGQVSAFTLWPPEALQVTKGEENISSFNGNPLSDEEAVVSERQWCSQCGGHLFTNHPTMGVYDVPAVVINGLDFQPGFHVHYRESVHPMQDGLPKFQDLPAEAGGSGVQLSE
jgi:hypothetical protein